MSGKRNNICLVRDTTAPFVAFPIAVKNCEQTGWIPIYKRHKHINAEIPLCKPEIFFASISENTDDLSWKYLKAHKTDTADRKRYLHGSLIGESDSHIIACSIIKTPDWLASLGKTDTDCHKHHIDFCNYTDTRQWNI